MADSFDPKVFEDAVRTAIPDAEVSVHVPFAEHGQHDPFGKMPETAHVSHIIDVGIGFGLSALSEARYTTALKKVDQFTAAMREEGVPEETVQRVVNRVTTGHPEGLEHWSREIERAAGQAEGRFTKTEGTGP